MLYQPAGEGSRTKRLAKAYLDAFLKAHPGTEVETVTPEALLALRPFDAAMLDERDALAAEKRWDAPVFALARQLRAADAVVVAAPYWDLSYPAALRTYIEYVSANGLTYHYEADGCHGDCRAERLVYLTTGGDVEREDSVGVAHWRQLAAMFGAKRFDYVFAGGLDLVPERTEALLAAQCTLAATLGAEA